MKSRDYRKSYSAQRAAGGGVVRDFSHELDYLLWIFGSAEKLIAQKSYNSHLEIDSEAVASIVMAMEKARHVNLFLSYLDRQPRRTISVQTDFAQIDLDLDRSVLSINGQSETLENESMDKMTQEIHRVFISEKTDSRICDFHQACMVEKLISKIDLSHEQEREMLVV
jgi:predicted dehydrogenase